jgi:hypothetical protein
MSDRWVCIHGHFYQPPRENPWLDAIEPQPSAHPYPDWNERITAECYRPNAAARIVDGDGRIVQIVDNYARMSFNVGPTLMSWFQTTAPDVHRALVAADQKSLARFGHGSAMAQAYNHVIMPLASARDRATQVRWGIADFRHRFGRAPEGMWLPECAVDTPSLEALAAEGIAFTILAPHQARRVRPPGGAWQAVDTTRAYKCALPSGRSIDLFFYDGPTSRAIAFEQLTADGPRFLDRLADGSGLRHVATDGETYGHHHRYGDMGLAWVLDTLDRGGRVGTRLTNYAAFRAAEPATWECEIVENSSWSCAHGVERWRSDCGCNSGGHAGWKQAWRAPLRAALDWLRGRADDVFERALDDGWAARDSYIDVVLDRGKALAHDSRTLELLEMQRNAMLMYTSCGWFFDELSGIETVQILRYAARVCELAERHGSGPLEPEFVERLAAARSNLERYRDGRGVWQECVAPSRVGLAKVAAHWACATVIAGHVEPAAPVYSYDVVPRDQELRRTGKAMLLTAVVECTSQVTRESAELAVAVLHLGEHNLSGGVQPFRDAAAWGAVVAELTDAFGSADLVAAQRAVDRFAGASSFSLGTLFGKERDRAISQILSTVLRDAESAFRSIYDEHAPLMRYLVKASITVPETFRDAGGLVLRHRILEALRRDAPTYDDVRAVMAEAAQVHVDLDVPEVAYAAGEALHRMLDRFANASDALLLEQLAMMAEIAARMESRVDLWHTQNTCVALRERRLPEWRRRGAAGDERAARLAAAFARLCAAVHVYVEAAS